MKVIAWNLAHQVRKKPIPEDMVDVIKNLEADTVLFNEYVDCEQREPFKQSMRDAGYTWQAVSPTPAVHNQIYAASRYAFKVGDLEPPQFDGSAISNFLHLKFTDYPFEIVGLRAPMYKKAAENHAYWGELAAIMEGVKDRKILFAGDVNYEPFVKAKQPDATKVDFHLCDGYEIPNPSGEWSYIHYNGNGSRIDHVIHTPCLKIENAEYINRIGDRCLAGLKADQPISDHAVLRFNVGVG